MSKIDLQMLTSMLAKALSQKERVEIILYGVPDEKRENISLDIQQLKSINIDLSFSDAAEYSLDNILGVSASSSSEGFTCSSLCIGVNFSVDTFNAVLVKRGTRKLQEIDSTASHPLNRSTLEIEDTFHFIRIFNVSIHDTLLKKYLASKDRVFSEPEILNRPWGDVNIYSEHDLSSLRVLSIKKDSRLSFQRHVLRDEYFVALSDGVMLDICYKDIESDTIDNKKNIITYTLDKGSSMYVKRGIWHRLKSPGKSNVEVMEVGYGVYDQINDIERKEDDYGRKNNNGAI